MFNDKSQPTNSQFILYQDDNGITNVNVRFDGQDVWLSQQQIAMLFDTTRENIVQHISHIYQEAELQEERTCKNFLQVQTEGSRSVRRNIPNYSLDMIIAIGYRVKSQVATRFRQWATQRLHGYIQKGLRWTMNALKETGTVIFVSYCKESEIFVRANAIYTNR